MAKLTLCVFSCTFLSLCLSFKAELALFVAIFQFVGREGRPFMFGRMTTDLGDKSRFPLFYSRGPFLWTIASPQFSRIFQILWKSLGKTKLAYQKKCVWHSYPKIIWANAPCFRNGVALSKRLKFVRFSSL